MPACKVWPEKKTRNKNVGGNSQNFLQKFVIFFVTFGLQSWDYLGLKYVLRQISLKGDVNYCINHKVPFFYDNYFVKAP